jgi:hypothetical protein
MIDAAPDAPAVRGAWAKALSLHSWAELWPGHQRELASLSPESVVVANTGDCAGRWRPEPTMNARRTGCPSKL